MTITPFRRAGKSASLRSIDQHSSTYYRPAGREEARSLGFNEMRNVDDIKRNQNNHPCRWLLYICTARRRRYSTLRVGVLSLAISMWVWDISKSIHCACEIPETYYINRNDIKFKLLFIPYSKNYYYPRYLFFSLRLYSIHTKSMIDDLIGM